MNDTVTSPSAGNVKLIYILFLVNILVPFAGLVGVIMAYINQKDADEMMKTHYRFQIRTFWIGVLMVFIGALLALVLIGYLVLLFYVVWLIVRCLKGMQALDKGEAHPNPGTWMFG